ncbi:MAG: hypothetical protein Q7R52_00750 [archaeon]|nr:hypothetical protein [archaeon]
MVKESEILDRCCICKGLYLYDVNRNDFVLFHKKGNEKVYDKLVTEYGDNISDTFCPECYENTFGEKPKSPSVEHKPSVGLNLIKLDGLERMTEDIGVWSLEMPPEFFR